MKSVVAAVVVLFPFVPACSTPTPHPVVIVPSRLPLLLEPPVAVKAPVVIDVAHAQPTSSASHTAEITRLAVTSSGRLLALSADQQLHRIDDVGRVIQTFTMPPGIRASKLCQAAGAVVALAQMASQPVALTLTGTGAVPMWSAPWELPGTAIVATATLDAQGQQLAIAIGAQAAAPQPVTPVLTVGSPHDQVAMYDVLSGKMRTRVALPSNVFSVNAMFRPTMAFINKDQLYYRGVISGKLDVPGSSPKPDVGVAAVAPGVVATPLEQEVNRAPSDAANLGEGVLLVAHGKHLRIEAGGVSKFLGYRYVEVTLFDMQGDALLAWGESRRTLLTLSAATAQFQISKLTDPSDTVVYDERHRIGLMPSEKGGEATLRIAAIFDDEPMITVPHISNDVSSVQFGQRSSLLALSKNNGDVVLTAYDRRNNTVGTPCTVKGYASIFFTDPALTGGVVAYSAISVGTASEMAVTAFRIEAQAVKVDSTFRVPGLIFAVDPAAHIYVAQKTARADQMFGVDVYDKNVKVRELLLPGVPQLSPDGRRLAVQKQGRLSVYDAAGQRLWMQAATRGTVVWAAGSQHVYVAAPGGLITFDANTGAATTRCGWNFGLSDDVPQNQGRPVTRSICERAQ